MGFFASVREWRIWGGVGAVAGAVLAMFRSHYAWVFAGLVTIAAAFGLHRMRAEAFALEEYLVYPEVFRSAEEVPAWLCSDDVEAIRSDVATVEPFSVFDEGIRDRVSEALRDNAWIRGVASVQREFPNSALVTLDIRKPIAWVEAGSHARDTFFYLVDRHGVVLPGRHFDARRAPYPMPIIRGALGQIADVPPAGSVWPHVAVREGIAVAIELYALYNQPFASDVPIRDIDVSNVGGRENSSEIEIVLHTESGVAIKWGRSLLAPRQTAELTTAQKIENLAVLNARSRGLHGLSIVEVCWDDPGMISADLIGSTD